ncbi:hypothetical protein QQ054_05260 [Oscillatoria amoena NRMC-F 0135]|nr:hypothetical protein [Oscillatoria amoena NRMC-F 0135]
MTEPVTISKAPYELESMQFDTLREKGLERITELSGVIWTDHNLHDPGITLLEALCYAITDLGYRLTFDIKDLLAAGTSAPVSDYQNFYTARQILHNAPLTINDYRKLLMDVVIEETVDGTTELLGIKNAWLEVASDAEVLIYINQLKHILEHKQSYAGQESFFIKGLYDVLFEFDESAVYGDLNENTLKATYTVVSHPDDPKMEGVQFHMVIGFPRWDNKQVNFAQNASIKQHIESFSSYEEEVPSGYEVTLTWEAGGLKLEGTKLTSGGTDPILGLEKIAKAIDDFIFKGSSALVETYKKKISVIRRILAAAQRKLQAHRNLCEDFYSENALRIEEILLCGDIEITATANPTEVAAAIYHDVAQFLSPQVYFYSLEEMQAKGYNSDEIFDGPALEHGFIDPEELSATERAKCIHASDIIRIIMDVKVDGKRPVIAVRNLQIANKPQDNADGSVTEKSVRWCLELAYNQLYVPRLSEELSKLTFYKDTLPFGYDEDEMFAALDDLKSTDRTRIHPNPVLDMPVPKGKWRETDDYTAVAEDLPLTYGVNTAGLKFPPTDPDALKKREAQANQLKGFLLFFDQLLEGYLNQLTGVKELFSMNKGTDTDGNLIFNKTYFTAHPLTSHPNDGHLIADPTTIEESLQNAAETPAEFEKRKNKFLDHLLARFCEQFTDYALLAYSIDGPKAGMELIKDKLEFLNLYPEISANRGKAFNAHDAVIWNQQNVSGYEKRTSLLSGINARHPNTLFFTPDVFKIAGLNYTVRKTATDIPLKNISAFASTDALLENLESVIAAGIFRNNYSISKQASKFIYTLYADLEKTQPLAISYKDYNTTALAEADIADAILLCTNEFLHQPGANRKNLTPAINAYITSTVSADMVADPPQYIISYKLYKKPFAFTNANLLMTGELRGEALKGDSQATVLQKGEDNKINKLWQLLRFASDEDNYGFTPDAPPYSSNYYFILNDRNGTIGKSYAKDFNAPLAAAIENYPQASVTISASAANNGTHKVTNAKSKGPFIEITINKTLSATSPLGVVTFEQSYTAALTKTGNCLVVTGQNLTQNIYNNTSIVFKNQNGGAETTYTITGIKYSGGNTEIKVAEKISANASGTIQYNLVFDIKKVSGKVLTIRGGRDIAAVEDCVKTLQEILLEREGMHLTEHVLLRPRYSTQKTPPDAFDDTLMGINTDADCEECKIADTYSFVMSVVMPYWPQRFRNIYLRGFMEKTMRIEAPAHLAMNICWINPEQMAEYELRYKEWLIALNTLRHSGNPNDATLKNKLKTALTHLIEIIEKLRTIYPEGRLHSCDESGSDTFKGAIVLNNTMLGTM